MKDYINVTFEGNATEISSAHKAPVVEELTADVRNGPAPLKVQFASKTAGNPADYNYYWVFEPSNNTDWNSHHAETAKHTFANPGNYTVGLTVTNDVGSSTIKMKDYINVTD
jgi:PKD repeat protein